MELFKASRQWAQRPADERFESVQALHKAVSEYRAQARTATVRYDELVAHDEGKEVVLVGKSAQPAMLTHWAFGQLAVRANAPAEYLRRLPARLAADCINDGLVKREPGETAQMMFHSNGDLLCRAILSERYCRIWNADVSDRLLALTERGWRVPPARPAHEGQPMTRPATEADVIDWGEFASSGLSIKVGDLIAPAGIYASDHDMFVFMIDPVNRIRDGSDQGLSRGFFCWNSEVGAATFGLQTFLLRHVCGNHIVWGAKDVQTVKIKHIGDTADLRSIDSLERIANVYANASAAEDEGRIIAAQGYLLGKDKEAVLDRLFGMRLPVSRSALTSSVEMAIEHENQDGNPFSAWGTAQGMTRYSQKSAYADERIAIDRAAEKVLSIAF